MTRAFLLICIIALWCGAAMLSGQRATFSSRLEAVRVDVSVTRGGKPVTGLTAGDFEILDNGVRQQIELIATENIPLDVVMALDSSGSVDGVRLAHLRDASQAVLRALAKPDRAALLSFSHQVALRVTLTEELDSLGRALDDEAVQGNTSMIDAAYAALAHADSGRGRGMAIVLSDGVDTSSWLTAESVLETVKRVDAVLFGISTGAPRRTVLEELADASGGDLIRIESTASLSKVLQALMADFRQRYLLSFVPKGVEPRGWHTLRVRTKRPGLTVKARAGYFGS